MEWKSDIEIAQATPMTPITKIAADLGVDEQYIEQYGPYKAKISLEYLRACQKPSGKLMKRLQKHRNPSRRKLRISRWKR